MTPLCLTDDQIDDCLVGELAPAAEVHLASCVLCQKRVAAAEAPLESFRAVSLAWAERRSATMPLRPQTIAGASRPTRRFAWASAAAAVVALGIAFPLTHSRGPAPSEPASENVAAIGHTGMSSVTPVGATPEQIESDNQMLDAIDRELEAPSSSPAEYGLLPTSEHSGGRVRRAVRD